MVAQRYGDLRPVGRAVASSCHGVSGWPGRCRMRLWVGRRRAVSVERCRCEPDPALPVDHLDASLTRDRGCIRLGRRPAPRPSAQAHSEDSACSGSALVSWSRRTAWGRRCARRCSGGSRPVAPSSSPPASVVALPPSNAATTSRPSTASYPNRSRLHCVGIGELLCASLSLCGRRVMPGSEPRCTYSL
jgi:hypothetical protein